MRGLKTPPRRIGRAAVADVAGDLAGASRWFSTAHGPAMHAACVPPTLTLASDADFPPPISTTMSSSWNSRLASLYGFMIGTTFSTPSSDARWLWSIFPSSPTAPMTVRNLPWDRCGVLPIRSISACTRSIAALEALEFITMIKTILLRGRN